MDGLSGVLFGWIDPGGIGQLGWLGRDTLEAVRMGDERGVERDGAASGERAGATVMNNIGRHQADAGVMMFSVVPGEEGLAVSASIFNRAEALGEVRPVLEGFELRL